MSTHPHNTTSRTTTARTTKRALPLSVMRPLSVALLAIAWSIQPAQAAEFFMKIPSIEGEVQDESGHHEKWINLGSVIQGIERPMTAGVIRPPTDLGEVAGIVTDKALPKLMEAASKGKVIDKVEIYGTAPFSDASSGRVPYFQWELKNAVVSSYQSDPGGGDTEAIAFGGFSSGNLVHYQYNDAGQPEGRVVESFRVDPLTGLADFDFVNPTVRLRGGLDLQPIGTPNVSERYNDFHGEGISEIMVGLTGLGSSGLDGFRVPTVAQEVRHNLEMRHGDRNNDARVTVFTEYGKDGKKGGNVETTWKVEEGESIARPRRRLELKADYSDLGTALYEYTIEHGDAVVAQGIASDINALVLGGDDCDDSDPVCGPASESVSLSYETIKWTYDKLDRGVLPTGEEIQLDPDLATSVSFRAVGGDPLDGPLSASRLTFANFESVNVLGVTAVPEPGTVMLTAIAAAFAAAGRRRRCESYPAA